MYELWYYWPKSPLTKIQCYFMKGKTGAQPENPKVVISRFQNISVGATNIEFHLDNILNPATASDSAIVSVQVWAVDVNAGWPGLKLLCSLHLFYSCKYAFTYRPTNKAIPPQQSNHHRRDLRLCPAHTL